MNRELIKILKESFDSEHAKYFCSEDIDAFFNKFATVFNIDMTDYRYADYFYEDVFPFEAYISKFCVLLGVMDKKTSISLNHLVLVLEKNKWFKPLE